MDEIRFDELSLTAQKRLYKLQARPEQLVVAKESGGGHRVRLIENSPDNMYSASLDDWSLVVYDSDFDLTEWARQHGLKR